MIDTYTLKLRQAMPLEDKIRFTKRRITEWVEHFGVNNCYVSFSGGRDSTVLLHIVRELYIINTLGMGEVLDFIGVEYRPNIYRGQTKLKL